MRSVPFTEEQTVREEIEKQIAPSSLYDVQDDGEYLIYTLKKDIAEKEWMEFVKEFYHQRYDETAAPTDMQKVIERISKCSTLEEYIKQANDYKIENYYFGKYNDYILVGHRESCRVRIESVCLSSDGKIIMECYGYLFRYLLKCIRQRLSKFKLADALGIYLSE